MGEFTAKIFTGGAVVFKLSGEHGFRTSVVMIVFIFFSLWPPRRAASPLSGCVSRMIISVCCIISDDGFHCGRWQHPFRNPSGLREGMLCMLSSIFFSSFSRHQLLHLFFLPR